MSTERSFDTATGRWLLAVGGRTAETPFAEEHVGLWVSRTDDGLVAECLVADDSVASLSAGALAVLRHDLGVEPHELVRGAADGKQGLALHSTAPGDLPATRTIHEPGIPYVDGDGTVRVPTPAGDITVASSDSVLMIDVPMRSSHEWVRVSDAATGGLLALGRVHSVGSGLGANVTFGLDDNDIHITLTDTPLDPVADRRSRRIEWIDGILSELRRAWWRRPLRSRAAARDAAAVARALGDDRRAAAAARFARLVPAYVGLASVTALVAGTFGAGALLSRSEPALAVDGAATATYSFGNDESATVSVDVMDDGSLTLVVSDRVAGSHDFGRDPAAPGSADNEDTYRANCLAARDVWVSPRAIRTVSTTYAVSLRSGDRDPVLLGTVTMTSDAAEMTALPESCRSARLADDGSFVADVVHQRSTEEFTLPAPGGIGAASEWLLTIERVADGSAAVRGSTESPVTFRVEG